MAIDRPRSQDRVSAHRPRGPLFSWSTLWNHAPAAPAGVHRLATRCATSSGRAALQLALRSLGLAPGSEVLVPTYHCPTMIAPVEAQGLVPRFYGVDGQGLPQLAGIDTREDRRPRAIIVSHLFDRARSLFEVRGWCDQHGMVMIEDCAHAPIGMAGERPAGHWGDFATASISKFAAVPEMGMMACAHASPLACQLTKPSLAEQVKGVWTVLDRAAAFRRPAVLHPAIRWLGRLRSAGKVTPSAQATSSQAPLDRQAMMLACDMSRTGHAPTWIARALAGSAFDERAAAMRRANHAALRAAVAGVPGVRALFESCPQDAAPYAAALWVDEAERVYEALRQAGEAVYRWDRVWPGTPVLAGDCAPAWRRHVLQCLCHQDLSPLDMTGLGLRIRGGTGS